MGTPDTVDDPLLGGADVAGEGRRGEPGDEGGLPLQQLTKRVLESALEGG